MKKLSLIIPIYNPDKKFEVLISDLLENINNYRKYHFEIIILVNSEGNYDELYKRILQKQNITIIKNHRNLGFAKAVNIGIKRALKTNPDKILLMNQDISIRHYFLKNLLLQDADISAPIISFKRNGKTLFDHGGKVNWLLGRTYHLEYDRVMDWQASRGIEYVSGCCMLIRSDVFKKIGYFDERFFMYFEDADFCIRAVKAGLRINVVREAIIRHELEEGKERPSEKNKYLLKSNLFFINKYMGISRIFGYFYILYLAFKMLIVNYF